MAIDLRFLLRRRRTGPDAAPADHLSGELAVAEPGHAFYYGYGLDADGVSADASHLLFRSDGTRIWHGIVGASDGTTEFVGDGSALTGVVTDQLDAGPGFKIVGNELRYDISTLPRG